MKTKLNDMKYRSELRKQLLIDSSWNDDDDLPF